MQIHNFLKERKRKKILLSTNSETTLKQVFLEINRKKTGFIILKKKNKYEIVTDGDLRRYICKKDINLQDKILNKVIGTSKITFIDYKKSLYNAARIFLKNNLNTIIITKKNKIISYIQKDEIIEYLSPERINIEKSKINKYRLDLKKHFTRYNFASLFTSNNFEVLDAACGTGYGSFILSKKSKNVTSIDYSKTAISLAKKNYSSKNISFKNENINNFITKKKYDLIVSIETLEHLNKKNAIIWLKKCKLMLKKHGIFICSSPLLRIKKNRPYITNPHHLYEMRKEEFFQNLKKIFKPKSLSAFIQNDGGFIPLSNEKNGLCFAVLKI